MDNLYSIRSFLSICLLLVVQGWIPSYAGTISLHQAEQAALSQSPEIKSFYAKSQALKQASVADGQFKDPSLIVGAMNVPVDTFSFNQEPMTKIQLGIQQSFPKGRSLRYKSRKKMQLSRSANEKKQAAKSQILRSVRMSWLQLYYLIHAKQIIIGQIKVFRHLVKVTESMLSNNKAQQKDVIRAQLELTELDNKIIEINQQIDISRAQLARWIGPTLANQAKPRRLPRWKSVPTKSFMLGIIKKHPELRVEQAMVAASINDIKWAEQQYIPGFTVGVAYGFRQGRNVNGTGRPNFLTAQINMDLPIFPHNRQSRILKSSEETLIESEQNLHSRYRQLREILSTQYASWKEQRNSANLYHRKLVPEAKQYAEATMTAYQNAQTDFPTLARAYIRELNAELGGLKSSVNRDVARANLFYLEGK